ncbi:hypothetical protein PK35_09195 [Tamlana nanhaiensis]|uniref:Uncharacterized protein n=1 Tax=Neotamlana nanhaiensis TaxID=1382798 RepID=A0A0D7W207_9FLAO|nr:DUF4097 family beta strand repeat-containing protein [Tamlana nanhaiensis]KJD33121.1 hypothetical protein PK35_09195 [Tamlana nanhaiensis]
MNKSIIKTLLFSLCFTITASIVGQQKLTKVSQSIKVDNDVVVDLNTSNTNIVIDTWNKRTVEIEAFIEGEKVSKDELESVLDAWGVDVNASSKKVAITTRGGKGSHVVYMPKNNDEGDMVNALLHELQFELADLPEMLLSMPVIPEIPPVPPMPVMPELPELPENSDAFVFDYETYKKEGDKYLEKYNKRFEKVYGDDYAKKMEAWGEKFGKEWGEKYGKEMEEWGKALEEKLKSSDFEKNMEEWGEKFGEQFGKQMEAWGERFAARMEAEASRLEASKSRAEAAKVRAEANKARLEAQRIRAKERAKLAEKRRLLIEETVEHKTNSKVKKTIIIKIPKDAKLKVNVKHGEIQFASNIDNLEADLAYTKLTANSINGTHTSINASYSPVIVNNWNLGELNLNYTEEVHLKNVNNLVLNAVSSNVNIENLTGVAMVDGNIGNLNILNIADTFTNLNIIIQNTDAIIALPKAACNFQFKGTRSKFSHPEKVTKENTSSFSKGSLASGKNIMINAKYCNVIME